MYWLKLLTLTAQQTVKSQITKSVVCGETIKGKRLLCFNGDTIMILTWGHQLVSRWCYSTHSHSQPETTSASSVTQHAVRAAKGFPSKLHLKGFAPPLAQRTLASSSCWLYWCSPPWIQGEWSTSATSDIATISALIIIAAAAVSGNFSYFRWLTICLLPVLCVC